MMQPFHFGASAADNQKEMTRFEEAAKLCKRVGAEEYRTRLDFYLHRQTPHVKKTLVARYPKTHAEVEPYLETLRLTRFFVNETAKVFLSGHGYAFSSNGAALDPEIAERVAAIEDEIALGLKLKLVDRYTTLDRTCFLRVDREQAGRMSAHVFLPDNVEIVTDPSFPFDLDRAYGVRLRVSGEGAGARYEFWCARPGSECYLLVGANGVVEPVTGNEGNALPFRDAEGHGILPIVVFTLHSEELGLFTDDGKGLWEANLSADVAATDIGYIAAVQGFGQVTISLPAGASAPQEEVVIGPSRAITLKDGATADILSPSPQIAALLDLLDKKIRRAASLAGIPPGSVSLEGRQTPSGVALQIEMRPLMEERTDAIGFYRPSMKRLWRVLQIVHDTRAAPGDALLADVDADWRPGEVKLPSDPQAKTDDVITRLSKRLISRAEAIAELRGVSLEEAKTIVTQIDEADPVPTDPLMDRTLLDTTAKQKALQGAAAPAGEGVPPTG